MDGLIRTAVDRCEATTLLRYHGRSVGSVTMETVRLTRVAATHKMEQSQCMDGALSCFLSHGLIQTAIQGRAVITSLVEYALSLCGVTSRDTRRASRTPFPRPHHNQRVELRLCKQRVKQQHKEKLGLEQHFRAIDFLP